MTEATPRALQLNRSCNRTSELVAPGEAVTGGRSYAFVGALAILAVAVGLLVFAVAHGLAATSAVRALLVVAVTQVLPGAVVWRCVRPRHGWWLEDLAMGFALGSALAVGAQVLASLSRITWLSTVIGPCVGVALLLVPAARARLVAARTSPLPWWWGVSVAAACLVAVPSLFSYFRIEPLSWGAGYRVPLPDGVFHLALAGQLATRGPTDYPYVEGEPLGYHWFSHAWAAQVSDVSGVGLDEVLFRFMPVVMPVVVVVVVAIAAVRISGRLWTGPVAAILTIAGGTLNVFGKVTERMSDYPYNPGSPSLNFATPLLVGSVLVLALRWRGEFPRFGVAVLPILCVGTGGAKGSAISVLLAGLGVAIVAMMVVDRSRVRMVVVDSIIVAACFLFTYTMVFRSTASERLQFNPSRAAAQTYEAMWLGGVSSGTARTFVVLVAVTTVFSRAVGALGLLATRVTRRDPLTYLLLGSSLAGAAAVGLISHFGRSQYHFARSAFPLMALASALGLVVVVEKLGRFARRALVLGLIAGPAVAFAPIALLGPLERGSMGHAVAMVGVAGAVLLIVAVVAAVAAPRRWSVVGSTVVVALLAAGTTVVVNFLASYEPAPTRRVVEASAEGAISRDQIEAARWIRDHSSLDDLVITNRHCARAVPPVYCQNKRFVVAAYSERQVLVEGWGYTPTATKVSSDQGVPPTFVNYWRPRVLALNDGFIARPTAQAAGRLRDLGVRWVFVDDTIPHAETLEPFGKLRFSNPGVDVYELSPTS